MKRWKRLIYYLLLNALVSVCATLSVLILWEKTHPGVYGALLPATATPTRTPALSFQPTDIPISAQPTPVPTATEALATYRVLPGDTLGEIAIKFDVTVEKLMAINGMSDPNALGSGQVIFVPAPPNAQPEETPAESGGLVTSTPPPQEAAARVEIANIFGAGDLEAERARLECRGSGEISLEGWQLKDEDGHVYTFPQLTLYDRGAVDLHSGAGSDDVANLYWGLKKPAWKTGETATLVDAQGNIQSTLVVP